MTTPNPRPTRPATPRPSILVRTAPAFIGLFAALPTAHAREACPDHTVIFVKADAEGAADGTTWTDAFPSLAAALDTAPPCTHIWVAAGSYSPGDLRSSAFALADDVQLYGGFTGTEDPATFNPDDRNLDANATILDGDIGTTRRDDNVFHVVTAIGVSRTAVLDGFTIARGHADGLSANRQDVGAGLLIVDADPTIRRCSFIDNRAGTKGGAVHNVNGHPRFINCQFIDNAATVTDPEANRGGAVYTEGTAETAAYPAFINCLFRANRAGLGSGGSGGAVYVGPQSRATLVNCTLVRNTADYDGGGVFGPADVTNTILWHNTDTSLSLFSAQLFGNDIAVSHSCIEGWTDALGGTGNIADDPLFVDPADNFRLTAESPALDAGTNDADTDPATPGIQPLPLTDLAGDLRIVSARVDIGAYERSAPCTGDADCDDHDPCTIGSCDAQTRQCTRTRLDCDDGLFCNGPEMCLDGACLPGTPPDCDDAIPCTTDTCDPTANACRHTPDHTACDDGLFCNGTESCDPATGCIATDPPCAQPQLCDESADRCLTCLTDDDCDDNRFCNGHETCADGQCTPGASPCAPEQTCDESARQCAATPDCTRHTDCDDANPCTDDTCDTGQCRHTENTAPCDDVDPCTTNDQCQEGRCTGTPMENCNHDPDDPPPDDDNDDPPPDNDPNDDAPPDESPDGEPPADTDADGVPDADDACPDSTPDQPVDNTGCACHQLDTDGDGLNDCEDRCPTDPQKVAPDTCGCGTAETDRDADTVPDCLDQCPNTPPDVPVDHTGCEVEPTPAQPADPDPDAPDTDPSAPTPLQPTTSPPRCGLCGALGMWTWLPLPFMYLLWRFQPHTRIIPTARRT